MTDVAEIPNGTVESAAAVLLERYKPHIAALIAYGSRVYGEARRGSAYDFWVIVHDADTFHQFNADFYRTGLTIPSSAEEQMRLNRTGPLFYSIRGSHPEIKFAVLGEKEFCELCANDDWWTVKGRMQKPLKIIHATARIEAAILAARREGLASAINLLPREFTTDALIEMIVSLSYRAEIRPENKRAKIQSIVKKGGMALREIYLPLVRELPYLAQQDNQWRDNRSDEERVRARRSTFAALRRSKWCKRSMRFIWRNFRSHGSPIRYIFMKVAGEFEKAARRRRKG